MQLGILKAGIVPVIFLVNLWNYKYSLYMTWDERCNEPAFRRYNPTTGKRLPANNELVPKTGVNG